MDPSQGPHANGRMIPNFCILLCSEDFRQFASHLRLFFAAAAVAMLLTRALELATVRQTTNPNDGEALFGLDPGMEPDAESILQKED